MVASDDPWEAYLYPVEETIGPGRVLRNKFEEKSMAGLMILERSATAIRARQLLTGEVQIPQTFDTSHVFALHRHLFQDVYTWAGEPRTVNITKAGQPFPDTEDMHPYLDVATEFVRGAQWDRMSREEAARGFAAVFAYTNTAHPFREGTGRTTKQFLRDVAALTPYALDFDQVSKHEWNTMAQRSMPPEGGDGHPVLEEAFPLFRSISVPRQAPHGDERDEYEQVNELVKIAFDHTRFRASLSEVTRPTEASLTRVHDNDRGRGRDR